MASSSEFSAKLALLRKERGVSQRTAARDLGISQALLSHYENGVREPGLAFVVKACDYYHVSADFILGRTLSRDGAMLSEEDVMNAADQGSVLRGSVLALLNAKLLAGAEGVLFEHFPDRQEYDGKKPALVSEYGGIRWTKEEKGWGYGNAPATEEEFLSRLAGLTDVLLNNNRMFGLCYTQLYDVEQEQNGLYTYRRKPKFPPETIKKIFSKKAAIED